MRDDPNERAPTGTSSRGAGAKAIEAADRQHDPTPAATPEQRRAAFRVIDGSGVHRPSRFARAFGSLALETAIVAEAAKMILEGEPLSSEDRTRLVVARLRLRDAAGVFFG